MMGFNYQISKVFFALCAQAVGNPLFVALYHKWLIKCHIIIKKVVDISQYL